LGGAGKRKIEKSYITVLLYLFTMLKPSGFSLLAKIHPLLRGRAGDLLQN
jgi:hypothetical protein